MPQLEYNNEEIVGRILRSTIGVISRRTTESYASVTIANVVNKLKNKYEILNYVQIKNTKYILNNEYYDIVEIQSEINTVELSDVVQFSNELIKTISRQMGQEAGYFFIKEIKESFPYNLEMALREIGINFDSLQLEYLTERKKIFKLQIKNSDLMKYVFKAIFEVIEYEKGKNNAYKLLNDLKTRLSTKYTILKYIKINDTSIVRNVDTITINDKIDAVDSSKVGYAIQKIIQEADEEMGDKGGNSFTSKIKEKLNSDYTYRLNNIGVDFNVIKSKQVPVVKHVLKSLVDVLSVSSSQYYAIMSVNNIIKKYENTFTYFKTVRIDPDKYNNGFDAIIVSDEIDNASSAELGRGIQRIIQKISDTLGNDAGEHFVKRFKDNLGKAYVLRIEELGVNLHMIELKRNLTF